MRTTLRNLAFVVGLLTVVGCGGSPAPPPADVPLTVAEWKALPAEQKYQAEAYERLKLGEPKFKDERAWDQFFKSTVVPGRKKEQTDAK